MEPIINIEGYQMMQDAQKSRDLLNDYYRAQGYEIVTPKSIGKGEPIVVVEGPKVIPAEKKGNH